MKKILICNDNNKVLENIKSILTSYKFNFDLANTYQVLLELCAKQKAKGKKYPVIITDLKVNKESAESYLLEIKKTNPESLIVVCYSYSDRAVSWLDKLVKDNENIIFLKKPFEAIELLQIIKHVLTKSTKIEMPAGVVCDFSDPARKLLDNISHEVRTPLASIVGLAEVLKTTKLDDEQYRNVSSILKCSDSLLHVITDMIDFDKLHHEKVVIEENDFSFTDQFEGIVNLVAQQAIDKDVDVNVCIAEEVPTFIRSDEAKLRQVLWHTVTNAVKYTNYGNVTVFADYETKADKNNLIITIKDTGIGIDEKTVETLFSRYHESSDLYRSGGSGLGLSSVKKIVDAFCGDIKVESTVDIGSKFTITIPVDIVRNRSLQLQFGSFTPLNEVEGIFVGSNEKTAGPIIKQFAKQNCELNYADSIRQARVAIQHSEGGLKWCVLDDSVVHEENIPLLKNLLLSCKQNSIRVVHVAKTESSIKIANSVGIHNIVNKPCFEGKIRHMLAYHLDVSNKMNTSPSLLPLDKILKAQKLNVLIAEDNEVNQLVMANLIRKSGHNVEIAKNGKIAVDKSNMNSYDMIFMDLQMPIMDGIEATNEIRQKGHKIPIIAMTSNISQDMKNQCEIAGVNEYLTKPVNHDLLKKLLTKYAEK